MQRFYKPDLSVLPNDGRGAAVGVLNGLALSIGMWSMVASFWLVLH